MSRVYFHSQSGDAELLGSERAYAGGVVSDLFAVAMGLHGGFMDEEDFHAWKQLLPPTNYLFLVGRQNFAAALRTWFSVGTEPLRINGAEQETFSLKLNTALRWGSDAVKLLARLHGSCEIHAYVEGSNRGWLADIIERGRRLNVLRPNQEWESVAAMLKKRDDEPVVTSYSVTDSFPNPSIVGITDEAEAERWWERPDVERWTEAMSALRKSGPELKPENWHDFYFMHGMDASDVRDALRNLRNTQADSSSVG